MNIGNTRRSGDLGPKQIAWLDKHLAKFKDYRLEAEAARKHSDKVRAEVMGEGK